MEPTQIVLHRDFHVVGAYPPGQSAEILTCAPSVEQKERIETLPIPDSDPIMGFSVGSVALWP